jgi:hypothetical protein
LEWESILAWICLVTIRWAISCSTYSTERSKALAISLKSITL